ncbi:MAG: DUF2382 domain-containing protein [Chloroflexi bacterium]|nr:DUF2382 domain-containing protein [Chloroflexota bacterium]
MAQPYPPHVPGVHSDFAGSPPTVADDDLPDLLPLDVQTEFNGGQGWSFRMPVRAEHVTVAKDVVVYERIVVRPTQVQDVVRLDAPVQREEAVFDRSGYVEPTFPHADVRGEATFPDDRGYVEPVRPVAVASERTVQQRRTQTFRTQRRRVTDPIAPSEEAVRRRRRTDRQR